MPDKFVTNFEVLGEIIKVKDENLNGTINEIIDGTIDIPYVKRSGDTMSGDLNMGGNKITNITNPTGNTDVTNKEYVDTEIADKIAQLGTLLEYKGTKPTVADLPATGNKTGDIWYVQDVKSGYAWVDGHWEEFGPVINLEPYFKKSDIVQVTGNATDKVMSQKATTDAINAVDLTPYFEKSNIVQSTGAGTDKVMSQKATTDAINGINLTPYLKKDGSTPMAGNLQMGIGNVRYRVTNLELPQAGTDAATKQYVDNELSIRGVKSGGTSGQILTKIDNINYNMQWADYPQATNTLIGGIKAAPVTTDDTQDVHITTDGHLKTKPSSSAGLNPITVSRDEAYISTPGNNNTTKVLADPTAPPDKPIQVGQIAVYSTTNQTYNTGDVGATLLVADPHSDMEAVNKRTNDTKLGKANIDDTFKRITAVEGTNPGTESYHILVKTPGGAAENRIPMYDARNTIILDKIRASTSNSIMFSRSDMPTPVIKMFLNVDNSEITVGVGNLIISKLQTPTDRYHATNKEYVDKHIAGADLPTPDTDGNYVLHYTKSSNSWSIIPLTTGGPSIG